MIEPDTVDEEIETSELLLLPGELTLIDPDGEDAVDEIKEGLDEIEPLEL